MSFFTSANRMVVTDVDGTTVFDTNERLFTVTNGPLQGSITLPTRTATRTTAANNSVNVNTNHTITAVNASANTVRGAFFVTAPSRGALLNLGWFNASGTYIHLLEPRFPALGTDTTNAGLPSIAAYTFVASGGSLYLNEQCRLESNPPTGGSTTLTLPGATFQYYLFAGAWV